MSQISEKKFTIVHFLDDNAVEVVPSKWIINLNEEILCYWPNRKPDNFKLLLEDHTSCPLDSWNKWTVTLIKSHDDYKKANRKATQYVKGLAVESSEGEVTKSKRRRITTPPANASFQEPNSTLYSQPTSLPVQCTRDEFQGTVSEELPPQTDQISFVNPSSYPDPYHQTSVQTLMLSASGIPWEQSRTPSPSTSGTIGNFRSPGVNQPSTRPHLRPTSLFPGLNSMIINPSYQQTFPNINPEETVYVPSVSTQQSSTCENCHTLLEEFRKFQTSSVKYQEELKAEVRALSKQVANALAVAGKEINSPPVLNKLPLRSEEEFLLLEDILKTGNNYQILVKYFSRIGGDTLPKNVYNVMKLTFNDEVRKLFRFTNNTGKVAVGNSLVVKAIKEGVLQTPGNKSMTEEQINGFIARWFRNISTQKSKHAGISKNKTSEDREGSAGNTESNSESNFASNDINSTGNSSSGDSSASAI